MLANEQISLRLGTSEDSDFLYDLHRAAMQQYVAQTWGWDEAWQWNYFQQHFNPAECQIITFEGKDVGVLSVRNRDRSAPQIHRGLTGVPEPRYRNSRHQVSP